MVDSKFLRSKETETETETGGEESGEDVMWVCEGKRKE